MRVALALSARATCVKLSVGCVLVDSRGKILGTGYNGVPRGMQHCIEHNCPGADMPSWSDTCWAVHAEQNALMGVDPEAVFGCYVTHGPCLRCTKMLLNTGCRHLVYNGETFEGADMWAAAQRYCYQADMPLPF